MVPATPHGIRINKFSNSIELTWIFPTCLLHRIYYSQEREVESSASTLNAIARMQYIPCELNEKGTQSMSASHSTNK